MQLAIFTWFPNPLILFILEENTGVRIHPLSMRKKNMEKYISTYTYFRQHEQCVPSTSFFEAKMNKSHKNDISEN